MSKNFIILIFLCLNFISCSKNEEEFETATRGNLVFYTSEDVSPIIEKQVEEFTRLYPEAKIKQLSASSRETFVHLLNDSVEMIATGRFFNKEELEVISKNKIEIDTFRIAYEGVVAIVNSTNKLSQIHVEDIKAILEGKKFSWSQIKGTNFQTKIVLPLCDLNDGINEYLRTRFLNGNKITSDIFPCTTTAQVISTVRKYENAIGFVSLNWLMTNNYDVKTLEIGDPTFFRDSTKKEIEYFSPHQAHIYRNYYPLSRKIYIFSSKLKHGVGVGLITHVATTQGQHLFVKYGLVPAIMPIRLIQLSSE
ncbi:MAG: substrate-binding domain-containing protein [Bacteroidota bacterium]